MVSKILIDVMEDGSPCINVKMEKFSSADYEASDDVRDKMIRLFFEKLNHGESPFVGVIPERHEPNSTKYLIPLTLGHAIEWMRKSVIDFCPEDSEKLLELFKGIADIYLKKTGGPVER